MGRVSAEKRRAAVERLFRLREDEALTAAHVRTVADGLGVSERTVWRWLAPPKPAAPAVPPRYELSETDRAALAFYRGNVAAVLRARRAVTDGDGTTAGAPVPDFLAEGWAGARPVAERTLYRAFTDGLDPAERAAWKTGEAGRRAGSVYLRCPDALRGRCWEMDHKQLPLLVLPPKGKALAPWLTTVVDDGTRALLGWAIATAPTSGTVLTAMHMALTHGPGVAPFGAVPELVRIDRGLEFAAGAVKEVLGGLAVVMHRLPAFTPHRKGKVERLNLTIEQMLTTPRFREPLNRAFSAVSRADDFYRLAGPNCAVGVTIAIGDYGRYSTIRDWNLGDVDRRGLRPASPESLSGTGKWMHETKPAGSCLSAGL
ncbi:transposase family protein [Streptomyces virginiae]|uniref:integrase catalytic domain-containing protein n=1 Tax=Streptomyces virginiae TaxID=1961 RepID=UPI00362FE654